MSIDVSPSERMSLTRRLGLEIKVVMLRRGVSQRRLAAKLGESQTWVSTRLTGGTPIDVNDLDRIAQALGTTPVALVRAATEETPDNPRNPALPVRTTRPATPAPDHRPTGRAPVCNSPSHSGKRPRLLRAPANAA